MRGSYKNIKVENVPDGMQVAFDAAQVELRVKKTKEDLGDLKEKNIKASIDLKDKKKELTRWLLISRFPRDMNLWMR